jgi:hypothetical protein
MNCWSLVNELGCFQPKTTNELLNIATRHTSGEEAVGAIFIQGYGRMAPAAVEGHHSRQPPRGKDERQRQQEGAQPATPMGRNRYQ